MTLAETVMSTPLGDLHLVAADDGLRWAAFRPWPGDDPAPGESGVLGMAADSGSLPGARHARAGTGVVTSAAGASEVIGIAQARLQAAVAQLRAWFAGERAGLEVAVAARGSAWRQAVWAAARTLQPGERVTYGELARRLGRPRAARAVGSALGANPCLLFTPCHRVVGQDGRLTGYAAGVERKRWLLAFEAASAARRSR